MKHEGCCIECHETLTEEDSAFTEAREKKDPYAVRLFEHEMCKKCITRLDKKGWETSDDENDDVEIDLVYSENLDEEFLRAENAYQGYSSLGVLDGTWCE